jgi:hypothetical protein
MPLLEEVVHSAEERPWGARLVGRMQRGGGGEERRKGRAEQTGVGLQGSARRLRQGQEWRCMRRAPEAAALGAGWDMRAREEKGVGAGGRGNAQCPMLWRLSTSRLVYAPPAPPHHALLEPHARN